MASKYLKRFGVRLDPDEEVIVCLGSKEGFSHMCLAMMGPGDTAIVPAPYFPIHVYSVALASGNVIALEVRDSDKFLSNIAYTCEHLIRKPKLLILNYPHNPSTACIEQPFYDEVVRLAKRLRLHGDQRLRLCRRGVRRLQAAELSGVARRGRRRRRVHDDEQGLQHGRLARRLLLRQPRDDQGAGHDQRLLRLRHVPGRADRGHHGHAATATPAWRASPAIYQSRRNALCRKPATHRLEP